jgi:hypothetical protein
MVFNSNGKTYLSQFTCNNVDLETLANYCYLGMVLKFSESLNVESTPQTSLPYVRIGVTNESNNFSRSLHGLCRAELNRTPLKSKILFSIFNFMNHIISSKNTLVYDIYISSLEKQILG